MTINNSVLVISDKPEQFRLAASLLRNNGYRVHFQKSTGESFRLARTESPNLIISELAVPDIDGLELCLNIRGDNRLGSIPILLVGDLSTESPIVSDGLRCGATGYLQKPFDDRKLFDVCREMVGLGDAPPSPKARPKNLFDALIENVSDAITIIDGEGIVLFASPSTTQVLHFEAEELVGKRLVDFVHPSDAAGVDEYFSKGPGESTGSEPIVYRFSKNLGSWRLVESVKRPIFDPSFGTAVVITSREKVSPRVSLDVAIANHTLRRAIFEASPVALAMFSASGHFIDGNAALLAKLSNSRSELKGMSLSELLFPYNHFADWRAIDGIISDRLTSYEFDNGYLTPEGERVWGRATLVTCSSHTESRFLIGIFEEPVGPFADLREGFLDADRPMPPLRKGNTVLNLCDWKISKSLLSHN